MVVLSFADRALQAKPDGTASSNIVQMNPRRTYMPRIDVALFDELSRGHEPSSSSTLVQSFDLDQALRSRLSSIYSDLLARQTELPEIAQRALSDGRWDLYEVV